VKALAHLLGPFFPILQWNIGFKFIYEPASSFFKNANTSALFVLTGFIRFKAGNGMPIELARGNYLAGDWSKTLLQNFVWKDTRRLFHRHFVKACQ
jgi:hypothetical protein